MGAFFSVKCSGFSSQKRSTRCCKEEDSFHFFKFTKYNIILPLKAIYKKEVKILSI